MSDLDPRGLEAALHAVEGEGLTSDGRTPHWWRCEHPDRYPDYCRCPIEVAESAVTAYLEVAQPVITTVEELEDLPVGAVFIDAHSTVAQVAEAILADGRERRYDRFLRPSADTARMFALPARVIWRPHESA